MKIKIKILTILAIICFAQSAYAERPLNEIPMYGGQHDPKVSENKEVSKGAVELGWKYYDKGDYDTAIKRFNQAWMFDRNSPEVFWGFGVIMGVRATSENPEKNLNESIKFLEKASEVLNNNPRLMIDLAYSETILGAFLRGNQKEGSQNHFNKARNLFKRSEKLETGNSLLYSNWAVLEFFEENYIEAKEKLAIAKKLGFKPNPDFENDLKAKLKNN